MLRDRAPRAPRSAAIISRRRVRHAIEPHAGRQREQQVRQEPDRGQRPHLGRIGAEGQDGDQRQPELGDLVAEDRDRLAEPQPPEIGCVEEEGGMKRSDARAITRRSRGRSGRRPGPDDQEGGGLFCCCASCFWTSWSISFWRFCRTRLTMYSPKSHGQRRATTKPMRSASASWDLTVYPGR